jgi:hypothetical protein
MRGDGLAKRGALHAVVCRGLECRLRNAERLRGDADAAAVQSRHGDFEAWNSFSSNSMGVIEWFGCRAVRVVACVVACVAACVAVCDLSPGRPTERHPEPGQMLQKGSW